VVRSGRRFHGRGSFLVGSVGAGRTDLIGRGAELDRWLADAEASGVTEIARFARKARREEAAIAAGCTLPWSNGQTEGQIARLKAIKRSMYGRAGFDLLRLRALYAA
jgi:transposase